MLGVATIGTIVRLKERERERHRMPKSKLYAVARGRQTGIFSTWPECQKQVHGFANARFKSFPTRVEAEAFIRAESSASKFIQSTGSTNNAESSRKRSASIVEHHKDKTKASSGGQMEQVTKSGPHKKPKTMTTTTGNSSVLSSSSSLSQQAKIHVMFDGGSRGNPGISGCGAFVTTTSWDDFKSAGRHATATACTSTMRVAQRHVVKARHYVGPKSTNNEAEYNGLCTGLAIALEQVQDLLKNKNVHNNGLCLQLIVEGDSQLIIRQLTGVYACKHAKLKPMFVAAQTYVQEMQNLVLQSNKKKNDHHPQSTMIQVQYQHVLREGNSVADGLANEAMDAGRSWFTTSNDDHVEQHPLTPWNEKPKSSK